MATKWTHDLDWRRSDLGQRYDPDLPVRYATGVHLSSSQHDDQAEPAPGVHLSSPQFVSNVATKWTHDHGSGRHRQRRGLWDLPWWANLLIPTLIVGGLAAAVWTGTALIAFFTGFAALLVEDVLTKPHMRLVKILEAANAAALTFGALIITLHALAAAGAL